MRLFLSVSLALTSFVYAGIATQTDWSGGPGNWGPVLDLSSDFLLDTGTEWYFFEGSLLLGPEENAVDGDFDGAWSVFAADIDGDGDNDVLGAANDDNYITWWENVDGSGHTWSEHLIDWSNQAMFLFASDIDGDGDNDVLGAAWYGGDITWWENVDGSGDNWSEHLITEDFAGTKSLFASDIDGDGDNDVLGACAFDNITWWENVDGSGDNWSEHLIDGDFDGAESVFASDIDGDGDNDVLGAAHWYDSIAWWENVDGSGDNWSEHLIDGDFDGAESVFAADIDGDGDNDVLGAAYYDFEITWWENVDGSGDNWSEYLIDGNFVYHISVFAADMDSDGDNDVLGAGAIDNITWWENVDGSGDSWSEHLIDGYFDGAWSVFASDIDGDGDNDVLGAARFADDITWWDLNSGSPGALESSLLDTQESTVWSEISWNSDCPAGTNLGFQVRATETGWEHTMPEWSDTLWNPCSLEGILPDGYPYVQYRVVMETSEPSLTPILYDVTLSWNESGAEEHASPVASSTEFLPFSPNPVSGLPVARFALIEPADIEFTVFNIYGRVVARAGASEYPAGYGSILMSELPPGLYICRMTSGCFSDTRRFVVIE